MHCNRSIVILCFWLHYTRSPIIAPPPMPSPPSLPLSSFPAFLLNSLFPSFPTASPVLLPSRHLPFTLVPGSLLSILSLVAPLLSSILSLPPLSSCFRRCLMVRCPFSSGPARTAFRKRGRSSPSIASNRCPPACARVCVVACVPVRALCACFCGGFTRLCQL